jgi:hypothetical protein
MPATPTRPAQPADITAPLETAYLRAPRVPSFEHHLAALTREWGDFTDDETAVLVNRAAWLMRCGASPAGAVEDAVVELKDGLL